MIFKLAEITNELKEKGEVIECGDWNAIITDYSGLLEHDEFDDHVPLPDELDDHVPLPDDYLSNDFWPRNSEVWRQVNKCIQIRVNLTQYKPTNTVF